MNTILFVDQDIHYARMINRFLTAHGFAVELARDGAEAVKKARELQPDLILLDLYVPRLDGLVVVTQLKEDALTWSIPVVALSALSLDESRQLMGGTGIQDYICKPFMIQELVDAIHKNLNQRTGLASASKVH